MALDRLTSLSQHLSGTSVSPHPFDPLSNAEIEAAVAIISREHGKLSYNAVTLREPPKKEMLKWLEAPKTTPLPARVADIVALAPGAKVYDGLVDLSAEKVIQWEQMEGVQPLVGVSANPHASVILTALDHHGGSADCRARRTERSQSP